MLIWIKLSLFHSLLHRQACMYEGTACTMNSCIEPSHLLAHTHIHLNILLLVHITLETQRNVHFRGLILNDIKARKEQASRLDPTFKSPQFLKSAALVHHSAGHCSSGNLIVGSARSFQNVSWCSIFLKTCIDILKGRACIKKYVGKTPLPLGVDCESEIKPRYQGFTRFHLLADRNEKKKLIIISSAVNSCTNCLSTVWYAIMSKGCISPIINSMNAKFSGKCTQVYYLRSLACTYGLQSFSFTLGRKKIHKSQAVFITPLTFPLKKSR